MNANAVTSGTTDGERSENPARWIDNIRFTLADIIVRGEWDDFGLFRILNRISFVCRNHLVFIVGFKRSVGDVGDDKAKDEQKTEYVISPLVSSLDPEFFELTYEYLRSNNFIDEKVAYPDTPNSKTKKIKLNKEHAETYAIHIWGTHAFVIVLQLDVKKGKLCEKPPLGLLPVKITSPLGNFISETLLPFDGKESISDSSRNLSSSRMSLSKISYEQGLSKLRATNVLKRAKRDTPELLTDKERYFLGSAIQEIIDLVDGEYQRLGLSPLLNPLVDQERNGIYYSSPNILFIGKVFNAETMRYGHYKYNSTPLVPQSQKKDWLAALQRAKQDDFIAFDNAAFDAKFWRWVETEHGRQRIVELASTPIASCARLFVESVLMSGTTLIKPDVFRRGAIGWIAETASSSERLDALDQIGCIHFLLQLGSPVRPVDAKELSLVALPFRCSGGIWMCAIYVRENPGGPIEGVLDQEHFEENALIYHSLFRETERRLRRKAKGTFTDALGKLIARATIETRRRHVDNLSMYLDDAARERLSKNMRLLTRIYPFDEINLTPGNNKYGFIKYEDHQFKKEENGFFDRLTLHDFFEEDDSLTRLEERVYLANLMECDGDE